MFSPLIFKCVVPIKTHALHLKTPWVSWLPVRALRGGGGGAGAPEASKIRNSHLSTLGYRMTNLHLTSNLMCYEGDLPIRQISHTTFYITDIKKSSIKCYLFSFWNQVLSSIYSHFKNSLLFVFICFDTAEVPGSLFQGFAFSGFWLLCLLFFSSENWARPIWICASSLSTKHLKQFHTGWSTLHSLGHSSETTGK